MGNVVSQSIVCYLCGLVYVRLSTLGGCESCTLLVTMRSQYEILQDRLGQSRRIADLSSPLDGPECRIGFLDQKVTQAGQR